MRKFLLLSCICFGLYTVANAQEADSLAFRRIADDILTNGQAYGNLRILCKQIGPRLSGSPQMVRAEKETFRMMKEMGADTVYLQDTKVPHWVRGEKETAWIAGSNGSKMPLRICALGNSMGTGTKGIKAKVVEVHSFDELDALGEKGIKGRIVYFNVRFNPTHVVTTQGYFETTQYRWTGASKAARYGAVGTVIRSLSSSIDDYPHTGGMGYNDSFPKVPAVAISTRDGDLLSDELQRNNSAELYFRTTCTTLPDAIGHNVVAELRGSEFPNEVITIGGHLDSWDLAEGAHDDGAGCVQTMELIRVFRKLGIRPKRTIRVVLFTDEENRGSGSNRYTAFAKAENKHHILAIESDAGGFTPRGFSLVADADKLARLRSWMPLFIPYGVYAFEIGSAGADVESLRALGATVGELMPDSQRYFDHHHAANDKFEEVNKRELELGAINMANLVYMVDKYGL
ncbi:M20/M25/M40 family metallo-hydrolase [Flavihumibacter profundi]|uniref:M20/M25/M40 family metallo-hydrolase n=1 Tax=Flavihumibacter profundi TaxID=2716883 RepID=UPI001CC48172|nr:M20/M25/M40 family metallo-hydrolase [Flavihumibacter profundi]MBZ5857177.1 M20/M25/M40 family metallo-hydrolase [Flavihumibacter profundi]